MRKTLLALTVLAALTTASLAIARPHHWLIARAMLADIVPATATALAPATLPTSPWAQSLIDSA